MDEENYRDSAEFFELRYAQKDYAREVRQLVEFISVVHPQARTLLDVACGPGNHLQHLKDSYEVEGLDLNRHLLELARERLTGTPLHVGDMSNFALDRRFDLVTCFFASVAMTSSHEKMRSAIRAMADHLEPDGVLFLEPYLRPDLYREGEVVHNFRETPERKLSWMYVMHRRGHLATWEVHWLVGRRDGGVTHFVEREEYAMFEHQEIVDAMAEAGLHAICHARGLHGYGAIVGRRRPWTDLDIDGMNHAFSG